MLSGEKISHSITIPDPEGVGNDLEFRKGYVRAISDLFEDVVLVSIHGNAGPGIGFGDFTGIETFYNKLGIAHASIFQAEIVKATGLRSRGTKDGMKFHLLRNANVPAILTENGFYNGHDFDLMLTSDYRHSIAKAHFDAIMKIEAK